MQLKGISKSRGLLLGATLVTLALALPFPLFGTLSPESAFLLCFIITPFLLFAGASKGSRHSDKGFGFDLVGEGLFCLGIFLFYSAALWINQTRFQSCSPDRGIWIMAVLALPPMLLNSITGLWIGRLSPQKLWAIVASCSFLLLYWGISLIYWLYNPSFRLLSHYSVVLLNDIQSYQHLPKSLIDYRLSTFLFALCLALIGIVNFQNTQRKGLVSLPKPHLGVLFAALLSGLLAVGLHLQTSQALNPSSKVRDEALNLIIKGKHVVLHTSPLEVPYERAMSLKQEGDYWVEQLQQRLGVQASHPVHIYLYPTASSLTRFTGASGVNFALPTYHQVHITHTAIPHPTLGHEIAHVLIGQKTNTLLGIPGIWGLVPNIGLTEGLAMALTPELVLQDGLTLQEQAAAMYQAGYRPDLEKLFSPLPWVFWSNSVSQAYVLTGAFISHVLQHPNPTHNIQVLHKLSQTGKITSAFASSEAYQKALQAYQQDLMKAQLPSEAIGVARQLFSAPSVLSEKCNYQQIHTNQAFLVALGKRDIHGAKRILETAHQSIQAEHEEHFAKTFIAMGNLDAAAWHMKQASMKPHLTDLERLGYQDNTAALLWIANKKNAARSLWSTLDTSLLPTPRARALLAKKLLSDHALCGCSTAALAEASLLVLLDDFTSVGIKAKLQHLNELLGKSLWQEKPPKDTGSLLSLYIASKQQLLDGDLQRGYDKLRVVTSKPSLLPAPFIAESRRLLAITDWKLNRLPAAQDELKALAQTSKRHGDMLYYNDLTSRAQWALSAQFAPDF